MMANNSLDLNFLNDTPYYSFRIVVTIHNTSIYDEITGTLVKRYEQFHNTFLNLEYVDAYLKFEFNIIDELNSILLKNLSVELIDVYDCDTVILENCNVTVLATDSKIVHIKSSTIDSVWTKKIVLYYLIHRSDIRYLVGLHVHQLSTIESTIRELNISYIFTLECDQTTWKIIHDRCFILMNKCEEMTGKFMYVHTTSLIDDRHDSLFHRYMITNLI